MNKIFFFSYHYVPYKAIGAIRLHAVSRGFQKLGFSVSVFSSKNALRTEKQELDLSEINVKYFPTFDFKTIQLLLQKLLRSGKREGVSNKKSSFLSFSFKFLNAFPFNVIIGEGGIIYIIFIVIYSLFKVKKNDIIFSSFSPYSDHVIAFILKLFKPSVFWICDFRDLHLNPEEEEKIAFFKFNKWVNELIIRRADVVTAVSDGLVKHLKEYNSTTYTLRNGIHQELEKKITSIETSSLEYDSFRISYTGGLYMGRRDPSILFEAISELISEEKISLEKVKLVYAGRDAGLWEKFANKYNLDEIVENKGEISLQKSLNLQKTSNINVLLTWSTPKLQGILTGKFYEYLLADRPICLVINGIKDVEFESIAEELNIGNIAYNLEESKIELKQFILKNYKEWEVNKYNKNNLNTEVLNKYKWENIINHFYLKVIKER